MKFLRSLLACLGLAFSAACSDLPTITATFPEPNFTLQGEIVGLSGQTGLTLILNDEIYTIEDEGSFKFKTALEKNSNGYQVSIETQPLAPIQYCSLTDPLGGDDTTVITEDNTVTTTNVKYREEMSIRCNNESYKVGGEATGLTGSGLQIQLSSGDDVLGSAIGIGTNGTFLFDNPIPDYDTFNVQVITQPTSPAQICTAYENFGIMNGRDYVSVSVVCNIVSYNVAGFAEGLPGSGGLKLTNNAGDEIDVDANGFFIFPERVADGSGYNVQVSQHPTNKTCAVENSGGIIYSKDIVNIVVRCNDDAYTIGGTVTGLEGNGLTLILNGASFIPVYGDGSFTFKDFLGDDLSFANGTPYTIIALTQPTGPTQTCSVNNFNGTISGANITDVSIICSNTTYPVGGTVNGLTGGAVDLILRLNGSEDIVISSDGSFNFPELPEGSDYELIVSQQPSDQLCNITNGATGTVASGGVNDIAVNCGDAMSVAGSVTGLNSYGMTLKLTGTGEGAVAEFLSPGYGGGIDEAPAFAFLNSLVSGSTFGVTIENQPAGQSCTLGGTTGGVIAADVSDITVTCTKLLQLTSVVTLDVDANGLIDHYKLTFNRPVEDASFPGYGGTNSEGTATVDVDGGSMAWDVSGYNDVRIDTTNGRFASVPGAAEDVDDDGVIYLAFDEDPTTGGDTGTTPDLTTLTADPGLRDLENYIAGTGPLMDTRAAIDTPNEADGAPPVLITAWGDPIIDAFIVYLEMSEVGDFSDDADCTTGSEYLTKSDLTYTSSNSTGAGDVLNESNWPGDGASSQNDPCEPAQMMTIRLDSRLVYEDFGLKSATADTIQIDTVMYDLLGNPSNPTSRSLVFDPELELYYPFDSTLGDSDVSISDISGNDRHGSVSTGGLTEDMSDTDGQAFGFLGTRIEVDGYAGVQGGSARTIAGWVKTGSIVANHSIVRANGGSEEFLLFIYGNLTRQLAAWRLGVGSASDGYEFNMAGAWQHVALTYDPMDGPNFDDVLFYIDGVQFTGTTQATAIATDSDTLLIGDQSVDLKLDELRYYSRALSPGEIRKLAVKVPAGMVAHYPLTPGIDAADDTTIDLTGGGNDLTIGSTTGSDGNDPSAADDRFNDGGANTTSYHFNGIGQYMLNTSPNFDVSGQSLSVATWFKRDGASSGTNRHIFFNGDVSVNNSVSIYFKWDTDTLTCGFFGDQLYGTVITDTEWHHAACTYDPVTDKRKLYLDGMLDVEDTSVAGYASGFNQMAIGAATDGTTRFNNGQANDVRVYDRVLTAGEVKALANEPHRGLVAYYPLDDGVSSGTVTDFSGNGNDLTIEAGPVPTTNRFEVSDTAYEFSNTGTIRRTTAGTNLPTGNSPRTVCLWAIDNGKGSDYMFEMGRFTEANHTQYRIRTNQNFVTDFRNNGSAYGERPAYGQWTHVCARYDGDINQNIINGRVEEESASYGAGATEDTYLAIGSPTDPSTGRWGGKIDDVRVYDRYLSDMEIREMSGFSPGHLDGQTLWLDAGRSLEDSGGFMSLSDDGNEVITWHDMSFTGVTNNDINVTAAAGERPIWNASEPLLNDLPTMTFDGIDDKFERSGTFGNEVFSADEELTFFAVVRHDSGQTINGNILKWDPGEPEVTIGITSSDNIRVRFDGLGDVHSISQPADWEDNFHFMEVFRNASQAAITVDGTVLDNTFTYSNELTNLATSTSFWIGGNNVNNFQGEMAEVILYDRALSDEERVQVACYLSKKYDLEPDDAGYCD